MAVARNIILEIAAAAGSCLPCHAGCMLCSFVSEVPQQAVQAKTPVPQFESTHSLPWPRRVSAGCCQL